MQIKGKRRKKKEALEARRIPHVLNGSVVRVADLLLIDLNFD